MNGDTWTIRVHQPAEWITANKTQHWAARARLIAHWRHAAYYAARQTRPRIPTGLELVRLDVLSRWGRPPVRDMPNIEPTIKAIVDGAIGPSRRTKTGSTALGYGIVADDSDRHVIYGTKTAEVVRGLGQYDGQVVLTVTDMSPVPALDSRSAA